MGKVTAVTPQEAEKIVQMYLDGEKIKTIHEETKRDPKTIHKLLAAAGVPRRRPGMALTVDGYHYRNKNESLCWTCQRSATKPCNQCSWAYNYTPVKGWTAEETVCDIHDTSGKRTPIHSYHITACPQYIADDFKSARGRSA